MALLNDGLVVGSVRFNNYPYIVAGGQVGGSTDAHSLSRPNKQNKACDRPVLFVVLTVPDAPAH